MESGKVGYWLQIGGNVAILFGLLFVAAQLYQERQLKAIEMSMVLLDNALQVRLAMMGEEPYLVLAKTLEDTGELSRDDALVLSQIYAAELILYEQTTYMQRAGLWPGYNVAIPPTMRSKAGYRYLDANLARIPLSDSTKGIWREELDAKKFEDALAISADAIREEEAAEILKERIRTFQENAREQGLLD